MEFLLSEEPQDERRNLWDDYIPIVKDGNMYDVYVSNEIGLPEKYDKFCHLLDKAGKDDIIKLHINTPGGVMVSAFKILHSLRNTRATTIAICTGEVSSAGTMIALGCQHLEVDPYLRFMCHNFSGGVGGKAHEIEDQVKWDKDNLPKIFKEIYKDFLTTAEISSMIKGKDIYLNAAQVLQKWKNREESRQ